MTDTPSKFPAPPPTPKDSAIQEAYRAHSIVTQAQARGFLNALLSAPDDRKSIGVGLSAVEQAIEQLGPEPFNDLPMFVAPPAGVPDGIPPAAAIGPRLEDLCDLMDGDPPRETAPAPHPVPDTHTKEES